MNTIFTVKDIFSAYKKVKHYFYYDNTSLFVRKRIADFEYDINAKSEKFDNALISKLQEITDDLNNRSIADWQEYFEKNISYKITPKSFVSKNPVILTNKVEDGKLELDRINILVDTSVEVHIIAALWLMCAGRFFSKLVDGNNYAYKLELREDAGENIVNGLRLYKPYFMQYQSWRDQAISKAEQLLNEKKDVVILSLDIKDYFHSVRIDLNKWKQKLYRINRELKTDAKVDKLFELLNMINLTYTRKVKNIKSLPNLSDEESILPIGLLSSGLLGNLYMLKFDESVIDKLNPAYYGRYVDDILFVFSNVKVDYRSDYPVNDFLKRYFVDRKLFEYDNIEELKYFDGNLRHTEKGKKAKLSNRLEEAQGLKFKIKGLETLLIQSGKVIFQSFDHRESKAIINKFKKKLEENRSEFRFLPDEDETDSDFDEDAFSMHYSDSINKLRSIKTFSEDKYGASKYLANKIFASNHSDGKPDEQTTNQILTFFKGVVGLSFHTLWEKVATYFIMNRQPYALVKFYRQILKCIDRVDYGNLTKDGVNKVQVRRKFAEHLKEYLKISISTPLALNPGLEFRDLKNDEKDIFTEFKTIASSIRKSNMFRHSLVSIPALNFTNYSLNTDSDLTKEFDDSIISSELEFSDRLKMLSPRYVHFHEVNILQIYSTVNSISGDGADLERIELIPLDTFEKYWDINYTWKFNGVEESEVEQNKVRLRDKYFIVQNIDEKGNRIVSEGSSSQYNIINVQFPLDNDNVDKKVAIANIKVNPQNIRKSILRKPNTNKLRSKELFKLINAVETERCDLFVLPEVSIPHKWIKLLAYQSYKRRIGIIAGLEHWINKHDFAFNFLATILPIKNGKYSTCLIKLRLKNHYSHEEKEQLRGYRLLIPSEKFRSYDLFHWRKNYFSVYNCFELADINDRSLFKSKVDFIVASEYNRDTSYFSDIAGSWVRDVHCFFIQVNTSDFGDSRLLQPAKSYKKDIIQIKGGENATILSGKLEISQLRAFQLVEYNLQKDMINDGSPLKPTPPNFNRENVEKRINNDIMD